MRKLPNTLVCEIFSYLNVPSYVLLSVSSTWLNRISLQSECYPRGVSLDCDQMLKVLMFNRQQAPLSIRRYFDELVATGSVDPQNPTPTSLCPVVQKYFKYCLQLIKWPQHIILGTQLDILEDFYCVPDFCGFEWARNIRSVELSSYRQWIEWELVGDIPHNQLTSLTSYSSEMSSISDLCSQDGSQFKSSLRSLSFKNPIDCDEDRIIIDVHGDEAKEPKPTRRQHEGHAIRFFKDLHHVEICCPVTKSTEKALQAHPNLTSLSVISHAIDINDSKRHTVYYPKLLSSLCALKNLKLTIKDVCSPRDIDLGDISKYVNILTELTIYFYDGHGEYVFDMDFGWKDIRASLKWFTPKYLTNFPNITTITFGVHGCCKWPWDPKPLRGSIAIATKSQYRFPGLPFLTRIQFLNWGPVRSHYLYNAFLFQFINKVGNKAYKKIQLECGDDADREMFIQQGLAPEMVVVKQHKLFS